jgi:hypothetical protein
MAQSRQINKKISVSDEVSNLQPVAQLFFTWSIVHADDFGLLPSSHKTLKALVIPLIDCQLADFDSHMTVIVRTGLVTRVHACGKEFYRITNFSKYQTLRKDRRPNTYLDIPDGMKEKEEWEWGEQAIIPIMTDACQSPDSQTTVTCKPKQRRVRAEVKRREGKLREEKGREGGMGETPKPPTPQEQEITPSQEMHAFVESSEVREAWVRRIVEKAAVPEDFARQEVAKFLNHWAELTKTGKKQRWETEPTFEVGRRLAKWLSNAIKWQKPNNTPNKPIEDYDPSYNTG